MKRSQNSGEINVPQRPEEFSAAPDNRSNRALDDARAKQVEDTTDLRREYAVKVWSFLKVWGFIVLGLVFLNSVNFDSTVLPFWFPSFDIESNTLMAIVGSTTVAMIGLAIALIKGLFPQK